MGIFTATATLSGGWGAHENARARKNFYTWRRMQGGTSTKVKLVKFTSQYNRWGHCVHWANLATQIEISLRNSVGTIVSKAWFNDENQGVTKSLAVPSTGNYAYSFELFHPGNPRVPEPYASNYSLLCHLEAYYTPQFWFESTFTSNTN